MKTRFLVLFLGIFLLPIASLFPQGSDAKAQQLAKEVWQASGGENWGNVKELRFTFIVEDNG